MCGLCISFGKFVVGQSVVCDNQLEFGQDFGFVVVSVHRSVVECVSRSKSSNKRTVGGLKRGAKAGPNVVPVSFVTKRIIQNTFCFGCFCCCSSRYFFFLFHSRSRFGRGVTVKTVGRRDGVGIYPFVVGKRHTLIDDSVGGI